MGAVKKVFKGIGSLFGIGHQNTPTVEKVDPTPTSANGSDVSGDTGNDTKKKKRRGFASTQTSLMSNDSSGNRDTLG